jgi:hypothetical protein
MQAIWDWLITDAGAGWVLGILGITWALYTWKKRERPGQVVVREVDKFRLLEISPSQHPSLTFLYPTVQGTQTSITNLQQTKLIILGGK